MRTVLLSKCLPPFVFVIWGRVFSFLVLALATARESQSPGRPVGEGTATRCTTGVIIRTSQGSRAALLITRDASSLRDNGAVTARTSRAPSPQYLGARRMRKPGRDWPGKSSVTVFERPNQRPASPR